MSVRLYAVARPGAVAPDCGGADGERLRIVTAAELAALVGTVPGTGAAALTEASLWRHEQAVEALMADRDVLPARYGTTLGDDGEVRVLLQRRREEFEAALDHVSGAIEVGVRVALADGGCEAGGAGSHAPTGTAYLQALARREDLAREISAQIAGALRPLARDSRIADSWGPSGTLASAHLVGRERVGVFRERAERLARETEFAQLVCTGPWPPYSFVGMGEGA